jgi:hypothetical protein
MNRYGRLSLIYGSFPISRARLKKQVKFVGAFLWALVGVAAIFSYTQVDRQSNEGLTDLCARDNYNPGNISSSRLEQLLHDLNELRLSPESIDARPYSLQWIDSCTGRVMVEMESRRFEKKLQKSPYRIDSVDKR